MSTLVRPASRPELKGVVKAEGGGDAWQEASGAEAVEVFKPLTRQEAAALRKDNPSVSPWEVLAGQLAAGVLLAVLVGAIAEGVAGKASLGWSVLYGALAVVVPGALFARGIMSKVSSLNPGAAVAGFFLWEMVKVGLTIAMLFAAPRLVPDLSWPAMLVGLVVTMKVVWLLLLLRARPKKLPATSPDVR
jgi:ATP synthase protein I